MKVFWSWQSDTHGKTGRHFVRAALELAIKQLREAPEIEEPIREALHIDQDRQGVPGSPRLADTIFEKISTAAVVIADITPVGKVPKPPISAKKIRAKKIMNPNVAIEVGYALRASPHKEKSLLMVLNEHYGSRADLPFDLGQYAGPIVYRLAPGATKSEIDGARSQLAAALKTALAPILSAGVHAAPTMPPTVVDRKVDSEYPTTSGIQQRLAAQGYELSWVFESRVAGLESKGSKVVVEPDANGVLSKFHLATNPEKSVLVKTQKPDYKAIAEFYRPWKRG